MKNNPYGKEYFEGVKSNYYKGYDSIYHRINIFFRARAALNLIHNHRKTGKLLEIGCAYGYFTKYFSENGFKAIGIDISSYAIKIAKSKFPGLKFSIGDIQKRTKFKNGEFDVIVALEVLEHCKKLKKVLKEIKRILKKGGILLISVPATDLQNPTFDKDNTHIWYLSLKEWKRILEKAGFKILKTKVFPKIFKKIKPNWCTVFILLKSI